MWFEHHDLKYIVVWDWEHWFNTRNVIVRGIALHNVPYNILQDRSRCHFKEGDACDLPEDIGQFGCVLAANLICRLPDPRK